MSLVSCIGYASLPATNTSHFGSTNNGNNEDLIIDRFLTMEGTTNQTFFHPHHPLTNNQGDGTGPHSLTCELPYTRVPYIGNRTDCFSYD